MAERHPWKVIRDLPCLGCGYNLRSLTGPTVKCPECGRKNDLKTPRQWAPPEELQGHSRARHFMLTGFMTCFTGAGMYMLFADPNVIVPGLLTFIATLFLIGSCRRLIRNERRVQRSLPQVMAGAAVALLIPIFPIAIILTTHRYQEHMPIEAPILILPSMAVSLFLYLALRRIVPESDQQSLRDWMRYCDAITDRYRDSA